MSKRTQYWINSGIVKSNGSSENGHYRSLDKVVWDILKCCGIDCCNNVFPGSENDITNVTNTGTNIQLTTSGGNTVGNLDLCPIVKTCETVTTIGTPTLSNNILSIPYTNETGITSTVTVDLTSLATDISIQGITYDTLTNTWTITQTDGSTSTITWNDILTDVDFCPAVKSCETVTTLINNGDGTATYFNESGTSTTFPIGGVSVVDNGDGTYTVTLADNSTVVIGDTSITNYNDLTTLPKHQIGNYVNETGTIIPIYETVSFITPIVSGHGIATYQDEAGATTTVQETITEYQDNTLIPNNIGRYRDETGIFVDVNENLTSINNTIVGHKIADYTNELGTTININETITNLVDNGDGTITYTNENGVDTTISITDLLVTTTELFTVNAGTTNVSTDNSLGEQTVTVGDILHFWSSNGSINFNVQAGSVVTDFNTESSIIPYTPTFPLTSTNVQDAIDALANNTHVPVTTIDSPTINFTQSGVDFQTITADFVGANTATIGQVPTSDGNGNINWTTPTVTVLADNGLTEVSGTIKLGGSLIETTDIYTAHNPFTISDTSVGGLNCQVDRSWGFDNYKSGFGLGYLNENIHTTYEVAGIKYYDELGQENCDGTIVSHKELYPTVGNDKTFTDFRRGQITNAYTDGVGTVNVLEVTNTNVKAFSAAPSGTTEITASGGAGKVQASDSLYLEGGRVAYLVAPQKLYVQPNNVGTATVGDVFTMVGVNGEAEWKPKSNNAWLLNGNAGTDGGVTDFLGTTDAQNLVLKVDNTAIAKFHNGYLGIAVNDVSTNNANGLNSFVAGESNTINGEAGAAFGAGNTGVDFSFLTGQSNTDNVGAFVYGAENVVDGRFSMVSGFRNNVKSPYESVFGNLTTNYAAVNPNDWNINDRLFTIGNGDYNTNIRHNALTIYKDGRFILNTDTTNTTPIQNTWFGINGTLAQNFNHIRTPKDLAAFSTEHTPSGNYAVFGSMAANSGISINNTKQFVFATTTSTNSTNLSATTTIGNYSNSGFLFGGGTTAASTLDVSGTVGVSNIRVNTANPVLTTANTAYHFVSGASGTVDMTAHKVDNRIIVLTNYSGSNLTLSDAVRTGSATTTTNLNNESTIIITYDGVEFYRIN